MSHTELEPSEAPFWHLDEELGELEIAASPGGPAMYSVRLKARTSSSPYHAKRELYPLTYDGTQHAISGKAYILVPDITLTVGLFSPPAPSGAIGTVTEAAWQGMRHHEIAAVCGIFYQEDRAIGLWEVDAGGALEEFAHARLWQLFESWLLARYPGAVRIFTDDAEPAEDPKRNRELLASLGYEHVPGTHRIFAKEVAR